MISLIKLNLSLPIDIFNDNNWHVKKANYLFLNDVESPEKII